MSQAITNVRAALHKALAKLGYANSHMQPAEGSNNHDSLLHELFIASEGESYFKKRREAALDAVKRHLIEYNDGVDEIADAAPGTEQIMLRGGHYDLVVKKANPSSRLNKTKIENKLKVDYGLSMAEVLQFMAACSDESKPATTIKAISN